MKIKKFSEHKGLGDTLEATFKTLKIDRVVDKVVKVDCGCSERRDTLNRVFPYKRD